MKYEVQGGVKNYLGKQKEVMAPLKWKSSPNHPETELAYITKAEKDLLVKKDLHGSLKGGANKGPSGIMSLNGYGSIENGRDVGMSGAATSAAESGRNTSDTLAEGASAQDVQDYRSAFIASGGGQRVNPGFFDSRNTVSPEELRLARQYNPEAFGATRGGGIMGLIRSGGFIGNAIRGLGQAFGLGKKYDEPTYDMRGLVSENPEYYNDLDNELMLSTTTTPESNKTSKVPITKNFVRPLDNRMTPGVVEGPYRSMYDYLKYDDGSNRPQRDPITFQPSYPNINMADGIVNTDAFTSSDGLGIYSGS